MKKNIFIWVMIASLVMATALLAQGKDKPFQPKPPRMAMLDLTEEQQSKIQDLKLKLEKEIIPLRSQIPSIEASLKQELVANQFNQSKVKNLIDQKTEILAEIELKQLLHRRAIRDLLTPEQQKQFDLHTFKEAMGRHHRPPMPMRPQQPGVELPAPDLK